MNNIIIIEIIVLAFQVVVLYLTRRQAKKMQSICIDTTKEYIESVRKIIESHRSSISAATAAVNKIVEREKKLSNIDKEELH
ncbi:MAG: hypothetical protein PVF17_00790 [Ignavibacteria bacterium]|jgi:hypothetical protein